MEIRDIVKIYKAAEKDRTFPFSEWHRKDVFERLIKPLLVILGYNPDQISFDNSRGVVELEVHKESKVIAYISSIQEEQRFLSNKISAPIDTIPDPETGKPEYVIAVVTNFEKWFFYFDGKEIYALTGERLEKETEILQALLSRDAIESGKFKEIARKLLYKEDNKPLREELNFLRIKIADKILQEKVNVKYLKNPDGSYNNELLNEITTRWITRFLALKLAEDSGMSFNFTLRDIRRSFELRGKTAKPIAGAKVKEETLSNAIRALMNEFERRYNGGIFMYEEGVDYITVPDTAFFDLLDFATGWAFTIEDARIIGFVYERFLGQEIVVEEKKGKPTAVLKNIGEARGRRKAGGIYYTPKYIVDYIVENTLGEILNEKRKEIEDAVKNLKPEKFVYALKEIKNLKVLDPACGSGSFLIKVLAEFKNFYEEVKDKAEELNRKITALKRERNKGQMILITDDKEIAELENKVYELKKEIDEIEFSGIFALRHNIYGVDLDPKAIDITAFTLMVQVYDELKEGARCPTMIGENLKVGNSLVSAIAPDKRDNFISRKELERFKEEISKLIRLRKIEKSIDVLDEDALKRLIEENFGDVIDIYLHIKAKYPNAIPTPQQKLLDEWYKRARKEPIDKTFDVLIHQTGLARIFLKEVYFKKIEEIKERIESEINKPLIRYFNSEKRVLKNKELQEILADEERVKEELRFIKDRANEISKSQPPRAFNWEIEFPEVFFNEDGTLKENPGFDVVVGNPPYELIIGNAYRGIIPYTSFRYEVFSGRKNTFWLFINVSYDLLKKYGRHSFIVPSGLLCDKKTKILREKIFLDAYTYKIVSFKESAKVFEDVLQSVCVFAYLKRKLQLKSDTVKLALGLKEPKIPREEEFVIRKWNKILDISSELAIPLYFSNEIESILLKTKKYDKLESISTIYQGDVNLTNHSFAFTNKKTSYPLIRGDQIESYRIKSWNEIGVQKERFVDITKLRSVIDEEKIRSLRIVTQQVANMELIDRLKGAFAKPGWIIGNSCNVISVINNKTSPELILGTINSSLLEFLFRLFSTNNHINIYEIESLPIVRATSDQQAPIISLVDAIIQKKKEYHSISQNIEDYIRLEDSIIRLEDFIKNAVEEFSVISSIKVKKDNFDALRTRIEGDEVILECGIRRKVEGERRKIIEWHEAGRGKIKDEPAIEFLKKVLEKEKRISKSKQKTIWQKIAEVKVPEFTPEIRDGFLKYKSAMERAKKLDKEITKIDRAIDRLVYDLYGLTEEETQVVEKSVWGEKFEEMYKKLPPRESALKLAVEIKNEQ